MSSDERVRNRLFSSFPPIPTKEWEEAIRQDLGGSDYRTALKWDTGEGVEALPFYRQEDLKNLSSSVPGPPRWKICQQIYDCEPSEVNRSALTAIEGGADGLQFPMKIHRTGGLPGGDMEGTAFQNQHHFESIVRGIPLDEIFFLFDVGIAAPVLLAMLENETTRQAVKPEKVTGSLLYDPYAFLAANGHLPDAEETFQDVAARMVPFCRRRFPGVRCLGVDTRCYHHAGATIVQELALGLATASEYMAALTDLGIPARDISKSICFSFSIGSNYFPEIARFRAVRMLWGRLLGAYEVDEHHRVPAFIHGETSRWNKTVCDPYTNLLRTTTEGMAAVIGTCDLLTVHPFDLTFRNPGDASVRLARNSQHIFKEEAFMEKVRDPSKGSYYIEMLTDKIAGRSWDLFREIEQQGGMLKALKAGTVATMIDRSAGIKRRAVASRSHVFIGTNRYPDTEEKMSAGIDMESGKVSLLQSKGEYNIDREQLIESIAGALANGACLGDIIPSYYNPGKQLFRAIHPWRGSEAFEKLRMAIEKHPRTPVAYLLPMGDPKKRRSRCSFASEFLGCGGYKINENAGFDDMDDAVQAIRDVQPDIVVLCSSDREYIDLAPSLCSKLEAFQKRPIVILSRIKPGSIEAERYTGQGIDLFIDPETDLLDTLQTIHKKLGVEYYAT